MGVCVPQNSESDRNAIRTVLLRASARRQCADIGGCPCDLVVRCFPVYLALRMSEDRYAPGEDFWEFSAGVSDFYIQLKHRDWYAQLERIRMATAMQQAASERVLSWSFSVGGSCQSCRRANSRLIQSILGRCCSTTVSV